mgnify:CR=1 FL=1
MKQTFKKKHYSIPQFKYQDFLKKKKVVEIGCLSDYRLHSLKNQARKKSGGGSGYDATLRMDMETKRIQNNIHQNYMNRYDRWTEREFGY